MFGSIKALHDHPCHFLLPPILFCVCAAQWRKAAKESQPEVTVKTML